MTTNTTETQEQRRARLRAGMLEHFEKSVRHHFANGPDTWKVLRVDARRWYLAEASGGQLMSFERKRDADTALEMSLAREERGQSSAARIWWERDEWYRGTSRDPRNRAFKPDEQEIITRVLAEIDLPTLAAPEYHPSDAYDWNRPDYDSTGDPYAGPYGDDDRCSGCGEHISDPHGIGCPQDHDDDGTDAPAVEDFGPDDSILIRYQDAGPDKFGRRRFWAFWIADNVGPGLNQRGVRGQNFHANSYEFAKRGPGRVRVLP